MDMDPARWGARTAREPPPAGRKEEAAGQEKGRGPFSRPADPLTFCWQRSPRAPEWGSWLCFQKSQGCAVDYFWVDVTSSSEAKREYWSNLLLRISSCDLKLPAEIY